MGDSWALDKNGCLLLWRTLRGCGFKRLLEKNGKIVRLYSSIIAQYLLHIASHLRIHDCVDVTFSQWSDLCTHGALGSGPQMQFGFELETKDPLHPEPVELCVSCGTVLKRQCPTLLLKEMEQERHFVCAFWSSNTAKKKGYPRMYLRSCRAVLY